MLKYAIPSFVQTLMPWYIWRVPTTDKRLYLTFDDGPHPLITPWVMEQLDRVGAKATFFCVGDNVRKYPEVARQLTASGHRLGNHTMHHLNGWKTDASLYLKNTEDASSCLPGKLFRPPYGKLTPYQLRKLRKQYQVVMWDRLSRDYAPDLDIEESLKAMKRVSPGNIIVFHDSEKAFSNLQRLLPELLDYYTAMGYEMHALPQEGI